jgi:hypothetical protein
MVKKKKNEPRRNKEHKGRDTKKMIHFSFAGWAAKEKTSKIPKTNAAHKRRHCYSFYTWQMS